MQPSQPLPPRRNNPRPKHWTPNLRPLLVERTHDRLDVILIHLIQELPDRLLRLRGGRVRSDRGR